MFIEELIEQLKSGSVWCWTRGGGLIEVLIHDEKLCNVFCSKALSWHRDGRYINHSECELDLIAICRNPKLIQEQFKRDTQICERQELVQEQLKTDSSKKPVAKDFVVWIGDDGYLRTGKTYQIERKTPDGNYILKDTDDVWRCSIGTGCWRFATPEEIAAAQELEFRDGVYRDGDTFLTIKKETGCYRRDLPNGIFHISTEVPDNHYKLVAPLPPDGYELRVLKEGELMTFAESFYTCKIDTTEWLGDFAIDPAFGKAEGIENGWLYAFPKTKPAPTTSSSEQACSTLVIVCRGVQ